MEEVPSDSVFDITYTHKSCRVVRYATNPSRYKHVITEATYHYVIYVIQGVFPHHLTDPVPYACTCPRIFSIERYQSLLARDVRPQYVLTGLSENHISTPEL